MFSKKAVLYALLSLSLSVAAKKDETCAASGSAKTVTVTTTISAAAATGSAVFAAPGGGKGFGGGFGQGGNKGGNTGTTGNKGGNTGSTAGNTGSTAGNAGNNAGKGAAAGNNAGTGGNTGGATSAANGDPQKSLTLIQSVIATGFANDGQDVPAAGQVASATSTNNFINFCATVPQLPLTNGKQIQTGSCNPAPMGVIASKDKMPSSKFVFPTNLGTIPANQNFTVKMAINNLETGHFTNAQANYFAAPQVVNAQGLIQGHSHIVIEAIDSLQSTKATDPTKFAFFQGLNDKAQNGVLSATVGGGLPAGTYRIASINAAANHQPALVAIAQHGSLDDMVYFTVSNNGAGNGAGAAANKGGNGAAAGAAAATGANATKGKGTGATGKSRFGKNRRRF
ncbi:hypothetical protein BD413DRAFT_603947 [Trametes elegans]|nr:hypothetical protein BD413DRAFT_603947 [Trametes elegans]